MATRAEMLKWVKSKLNQSINVDGAYGAQCVDLIMAYVLEFANFRTCGNAIDYMNNALPVGWRRYKKGEAKVAPGDIAIWHWGAYDRYGHVGIVLEVDGDYLVSMEQNVDGSPELGGPARKVRRISTYLVGFIRPLYDQGEMWMRIPENGKFTVTVDLINVRAKPDVNSEKVAEYKKGESLYYDSYVVRQGYVWISYISYSNIRRYLATGTYDGQKRTRWGVFS